MIKMLGMYMGNIHYFCSYCDQGYIARLLCLRQSLLDQNETFRLAVLCFDDITLGVVNSMGGEELFGISLDNFLSCNSDYAAVFRERTRIDAYFTATPVLIRYCFDIFPDASAITYLDSDLFFFGPASLVFDAQSGGDIGIVPHRFPERLKHLTKCGTYNVGWVSFLRSRDGIGCVDWWRARCIEWCEDRVEGNRYADQGYLDEFPGKFRGVSILCHHGINLAPWNVGGVRVENVAGRVQVNGVRLLFYHFQGVRELISGWYDIGLASYGVQLMPSVRDLIYKPYLNAYARNVAMLAREYGIARQFGYKRLRFDDGPCLSFVKRLLINGLVPYWLLARGRLMRCSISNAETDWAL